MKTLHALLSRRLSPESIDLGLAQWACYLASLAIVPTAVVALRNHPGSRAEFLLGFGLACLLGLLLMMLGTLCRRGAGVLESVAWGSRWAEFASYLGCIGFMIVGFRSLPALGLSPVQVTLGALLICALSLAVLVLGMMTTVVRLLTGGSTAVQKRAKA